MYIKFADNSSIEITMADTPVEQELDRCYKHLQFMSLPVASWRNPFHGQTISYADDLAHYGNLVGVTVDTDRVRRQDQLYFNELHEIFEKNYIDDARWLDYHDHIHLCEPTPKADRVCLEYRDLAGPITQKFQRAWYAHGVSKVHAGQVYCSWQELGKTPYEYWRTCEPNSINRIKELVKPWLLFRPNLKIAMSDQDFTTNVDFDNFMSWWQEYQDQWMQHWHIEDWHPLEQFLVIPVGRVKELPKLKELCEQDIPPVQIVPHNQSNCYMHRFEFDISASWSTVGPHLTMSIDDVVVANVALKKGNNKICFDHTLMPGKHRLTIDRQGATDQDPMQMVVIEKMLIDNLDQNQLILKKSYFCPQYPDAWAQQQRHNGSTLSDMIPFETVLGHNGIWILDLESPFYPYFLKISRAPFS